MSKTLVTVFIHPFLMLVNKNTSGHCLFMLVHSALTNVNKYYL